MRPYLRLIGLGVCLAVMEVGARPATSPGLGIANVSITEGDTRTVITAVDADDQLVARLELVHGRFVPTEDFGPEYRGEVNGRRLRVDVNGQTIAWETIGFTDTTHMPALPPELHRVAMFLADGRVRPILDKWRIGWERGPAPAIGRRSVPPWRNDALVEGTNPVECSGLTCPLRANTTATCNGFPAYQAFVVRQDAASFGWEQDVVSACCNATASFLFPDAYIVKTCSAAAGPPFESSCGLSGSNRCKGCGTVPITTSCSLSARPTGEFNLAGVPKYRIHHCDAEPGTPPTITKLPTIEIRPPNREMRTFTLADLVTAVDACDNPLDVNALGTITSITSNEGGDDQYVILGASSFKVRAERDGFGKGRIYDIRFQIEDPSFGFAFAAGVVLVPHDRGGIGVEVEKKPRHPGR